MKFSVITPTRNSLDKLKCCVGSVRGQKGVLFEHIVQDACSEDGTTEWLAKQSDLDWRSENDGGMYDAINRGWERANGDILCWLNSDEQYLPGTLEHVAATFEANPQLDFLYGDAIIVNVKGQPIAARREIRLSRIYITNSFLNALSCTLFYRRSLFDSGTLKLDANLRYAADMDLILRLLTNKSRHTKLNRYLSTFTLDGTNLSCHPGMLAETRIIQSKFGAFKNPVARKLVTTGRYIERLLSGSYRKTNISYLFAENESPTYQEIHARKISGSYRTR